MQFYPLLKVASCHVMLAVANLANLASVYHKYILSKCVLYEAEIRETTDLTGFIFKHFQSTKPTGFKHFKCFKIQYSIAFKRSAGKAQLTRKVS